MCVSVCERVNVCTAVYIHACVPDYGIHKCGSGSTYYIPWECIYMSVCVYLLKQMYTCVCVGSCTCLSRCACVFARVPALVDLCACLCACVCVRL